MSGDVDGSAAPSRFADAEELSERGRAFDGRLVGAGVRVNVILRAVDGERSFERADPGSRPVLTAPVVHDIVFDEGAFRPAIDADVGIADVGRAGNIDLEVRI